MVDLLDNQGVDDEAVEHAHLDFLAMDLDLVVDNLDTGAQFLEWEEQLPSSRTFGAQVGISRRTSAIGGHTMVGVPGGWIGG